jgi:hypothetical protein
LDRTRIGDRLRNGLDELAKKWVPEGKKQDIAGHPHMAAASGDPTGVEGSCTRELVRPGAGRGIR